MLPPVISFYLVLPFSLLYNVVIKNKGEKV